MKVIKNIVVSLICIALVIGVAMVGVQVYFKKKHDIDLFATIGNFKTLSQTVNEETLVPNAYGKVDQEGAKTNANNSIDGIVTYEEPTEKYSVNLTNISSNMNCDIDFTDKQLGAFAQMMVETQMDSKIKISESTSLEFAVKQVAISDAKTDGSATLNIVVKFELSSIKEQMSSFPMSLVKKYVPDALYVSSTVDVAKDSEDDFKYTISSKSLTFNNLTSEETSNIFKTLDYFLKTGSAESLNEQIGETVMNVLVGVDGDDTKQGLAVALKPVGAVGYKFMTDSDSVGHFVIVKSTTT